MACTSHQQTKKPPSLLQDDHDDGDLECYHGGEKVRAQHLSSITKKYDDNQLGDGEASYLLHVVGENSGDAVSAGLLSRSLLSADTPKTYHADTSRRPKQQHAYKRIDDGRDEQFEENTPAPFTSLLFGSGTASTPLTKKTETAHNNLPPEKLASRIPSLTATKPAQPDKKQMQHQPMSQRKKESKEMSNPIKTPTKTSHEATTPAASETKRQKASIVTGTLVSPFSPLLQPKKRPPLSTNPNRAPARVESNEEISETTIFSVPSALACERDLSLQPCRKLSVVVHVSYQSSPSSSSISENSQLQHLIESCATEPTDASTATRSTSTLHKNSQQKLDSERDKLRATTASQSSNSQLCLFPLLPETSKSDEALDSATVNSNSAQQKPIQLKLSPTSATLQNNDNTRDLVLVNPSAFGRFIPSEITMQTARLVAQVANIESEDWARTYRFQHVIWPDNARNVVDNGNAVANDGNRSQSMATGNAESQSLGHLATALANDLLVFSNAHSSLKQKQAKKKPISNRNNDISTSRVVISVGSRHDKTHRLFGRAPAGNTGHKDIAKATATASASAASSIPSSANEQQQYDQGHYNQLRKQIILQEYGVLGLTLDALLQQLPQFAVCALSVYEILQDEEIIDLLAIPTKNSRIATGLTKTKGTRSSFATTGIKENGTIPREKSKRQVRLRPSNDRKGAMLEGLTEYPVDSLENLRECLMPILSSPLVMQVEPRHDFKESKAAKQIHASIPTSAAYRGGHVVVSLKIWQSSVQQDLNLRTRCATLTLVDLATLPFGNQYHGQPATDDSINLSRTSSPNAGSFKMNSSSGTLSQPPSPSPQLQPSLTLRQTNFLRTSVSSLGSVLRGTLLREVGNDSAIPYRSSTLTKVLQRSLDHPECRSVVLASVSPLSSAYEETLTTLRYVERLLLRSGLPKSPFEKRPYLKLASSKPPSPQHSIASRSATSSPPSQPQILMEQFAGRESILESVVTDPRQRLAKFYRSQQVATSPSESTIGSNADSFWWKGPSYSEDKSPSIMKYMKADPADHSDTEQNTRIERGQQGETKDHLTSLAFSQTSAKVANQEEEANKHKRYTPLAKYVNPSISPSLLIDTSAMPLATNNESTQAHGFPFLEAVDTFDSNISSLLDVSPYADLRRASSQSIVKPDGTRAEGESTRDDAPLLHELEANQRGHDKTFSLDGETADDRHPVVPAGQQHQVTQGGNQGTKTGVVATAQSLVHEWPTSIRSTDSNSGRSPTATLLKKVATEAIKCGTDLIENDLQDAKVTQSIVDLSIDAYGIRQNDGWFQPARSPLAREEMHTAKIDKEKSQERFKARNEEAGITPQFQEQAIGVYQNPDFKMSLSSGFFRDLATLESSVGVMKNVHHDIWQTSASSIQHLKKYQLVQQALVEDLISQRDKAVEDAKRHRDECFQIAQRIEEKDAEIVGLKDDVDQSHATRVETEKIAEEAIAAQDALEQNVADLEKQLIANRTSAEAAYEELRRVANEKQAVVDELYEAKSASNSLQSELKESKMSISDLQFQLSTIKNDCNHLARRFASSDDTAKKLKDELEKTKRKNKTEKEDMLKTITRLKQENADARSRQRAREVELLRQLNESISTCSKAQDDLQLCRAEIEVIRQQHEKCKTDLAADVSTLQNELFRMENAFQSSENTKASALEERDKIQEKYELVSSELETTRAELSQRILDVEELSSSLQKALDKHGVLQDENLRKGSELENFQAETKQRIFRVAKYREDAASLLRQTMEENRVLVVANDQLQRAIEKTRTERDEAIKSLEANRRAMSDLDSAVAAPNDIDQENATETNDTVKQERDFLKSEVQNLKTMLREIRRERNDVQSYQERSNQWQGLLQHENNNISRQKLSDYPKTFSLQEAEDNSLHHLQRATGIVPLSTRAEEIAACIALSARQRIKENVSDQDKDLLIEALKRKVRILERGLVFGGGASAARS